VINTIPRKDPVSRVTETVPDKIPRIRGWMSDWRVILMNSRQFSAYFFLLAVVIILAFLVYAQIFVVQPMREEARQMIERYAFFYRISTRDTIIVPQSGPDLEIIFETITNTNFPMVITDRDGEPQLWKAVGIPPSDTSAVAREAVRRIVQGLDLENPPFPFEIPQIGPRILHFGDSDLVKRLSWLPFVALLITVLFAVIGYAGFRHIKNSEQRSIWVGMARETAHQLGTPLSSLYGWIELMKSELEANTGIDQDKLLAKLEQAMTEMERDTSRLNKIASRFSQIGSTPELKLDNLKGVISETAAYLRHRLPSDVQVSIQVEDVPELPMNRELLSWALENLFKNAADAMEGKQGRLEVTAATRSEGAWVDILVRDNGKGIQPHLVKQVFLPGYSTKMRGWGLGLAFVKRIVEEYHRGKISVRESVPGVGTTFLVSFPTVVPEPNSNVRHV